MSFSQALTPKVVLDKGDTNFCFSIDQAQEIVYQLKNSVYCAALEEKYRNLISNLELNAQFKDSIINSQTTIVQNQSIVIFNTKNEVGIREKEIELLRDEIKLHKRQKRLLGGLSILVALIAIVK